MDPIETKNELQTLFGYLVSLIRNPVKEIQSLPEISLKTLIIFQFCLSFLSVVISNLLAPYAISMVQVLVSLIIAVSALTLSSLFFYYFFLIIYNTPLSFVKIFTLVLFSHIPFAIFHLASYYFPPVDLIGLGISSLLMIIGMVENFRVPKKLATKLMMGLYALFFVYWVMQTIHHYQFSKMTPPQDMDSIEKELKDEL
ncbi:MAG: hypothetical protein KDD33_10185 [Bdellovibrionales bacterium]|nr:hypothetical protein [Bdellovibrionales bacterium]